MGYRWFLLLICTIVTVEQSGAIKAAPNTTFHKELSELNPENKYSIYFSSKSLFPMKHYKQQKQTKLFLLLHTFVVYENYFCLILLTRITIIKHLNLILVVDVSSK